MKLISKTKLKSLKNCRLQFFLDINNPELKEYSESTKASFQVGNSFEEKVKKEFKNGHLVKSIKNEHALKETSDLLKSKSILFEAAFSSNNLIIRSDICLNDFDNSLKFIEIKSGASLKKDYLIDALIQFWTIKDSGINIKSFEIWNVNKKSKGSQSNIKKNDVMKFCMENESIFRDLIKDKDSILTQKNASPTYGSHCQNCPFFKHCFKNIENNHQHVYSLPNFDKKWEALNNKIETINDPKFQSEYKEYMLENPIVIKSILENKFLINKKEVSRFVNTLKYPINLIDFEAISVSESLFKNTTPYEVCVVQINHGLLYEDGTYIKNIYLIEDKKQYNKTALAQKLVEYCNLDGSVIVWDSSLELKIFNDFKKASDDSILKSQIQELINSTIDLKKLFDSYIYKPEFLGQMNLKNVSSKILLKNIYENSSISHGSQINDKYIKIINKEDGYEQIKKDIILYGENDILSLKNLILWLRRSVLIS